MQMQTVVDHRVSTLLVLILSKVSTSSIWKAFSLKLCYFLTLLACKKILLDLSFMNISENSWKSIFDRACQYASLLKLDSTILSVFFGDFQNFCNMNIHNLPLKNLFQDY